jgi:DNA-binding NtrC family response regulator
MPEPTPIVVIDDNPGSLEFLSAALAGDAIAVHTALRPEDGVALVRKVRPALVLTDLVMPGMSGLEVLTRVLEIDPAIDVVLMTAHYTSETAVEAIRKGAADYLEKPLKLALLRERVQRLLAASRHRRRAADSVFAEDAQFEGIIARGPLMWAMFSAIERIAPHFRSVLVHGPTGAGKDLVARALHRLSGVSGNYVVLNCSAVVETLFESELFGHVKGAFTGADKDKPGLIEHADRGTLFLDEIGDMPLATQAKLLRAVQNQEVQRVGSLTPRRVNVRIVAATHRDLRAAIAAGRFREDLYYRLTMVEIEVPPLAARPEDIPLLAQHFIAHFAEEYGKRIRGLAPRAKAALERYAWPGNVRELENAIGHACMMASGELIEPRDLPPRILQSEAEATASSSQDAPAAPASPLTNNGPAAKPAPGLAAQERDLIARALDQANGNQSHAAIALGIGRDALRYKMKKYGLS